MLAISAHAKRPGFVALALISTAVLSAVIIALFHLRPSQNEFVISHYAPAGVYVDAALDRPGGLRSGIYMSDAPNDNSCCWTTGDAKFLVEPVRNARYLYLRFYVPALVFNPAPRRLRVAFLNKTHDLCCYDSGSHVVAIPVEHSALARERLVEVALRSDGVFVPALHRMGQDQRALSIILNEVRFVTDAPQAFIVGSLSATRTDATNYVYVSHRYYPGGTGVLQATASEWLRSGILGALTPGECCWVNGTANIRMRLPSSATIIMVAVNLPVTDPGHLFGVQIQVGNAKIRNCCFRGGVRSVPFLIPYWVQSSRAVQVLASINAYSVGRHTPNNGQIRFMLRGLSLADS